MSTLNLSTNVPIDVVATSDILKDSTRTLAKIIGKPKSITLCAVVNFFRQFKKSATTTTLGEELLKLGKSKEGKLKRVTLQIQGADIIGSFLNKQIYLMRGTDSFKIAWSSDEP